MTDRATDAGDVVGGVGQCPVGKMQGALRAAWYSRSKHSPTQEGASARRNQGAAYKMTGSESAASSDARREGPRTDGAPSPGRETTTRQARQVPQSEPEDVEWDKTCTGSANEMMTMNQ